jgi:hypothetical protein
MWPPNPSYDDPLNCIESYKYFFNFMSLAPRSNANLDFGGNNPISCYFDPDSVQRVQINYQSNDQMVKDFAFFDFNDECILKTYQY